MTLRGMIGTLLKPGLRTLSVGIVVFCLALIVTIWAAIEERTVVERDDALRAATRHNTILAVAFEQYSLRILRSAGAVTQFVESAYLRGGQDTDLAALLAGRVAADDILEVIAVFNARGQLVATSQQPTPPDVIISAREEFKVHVSGTGPKMYVGKTGVTPLWHEAAVPITRRVVRADGSFGGVVLALVRPQRFTSFYEDAAVHPSGVIVLAGLDGFTRARKVGMQDTFGENLNFSALLQQRAQQANGVYRGKADVDGVMRLHAYRTMPDFPLVAVVASYEDQVLAEYSARKSFYYLGAAAASICIVFFALVVIATIVRVARATRVMTESEERFRALSELSADWWWEQDEEFRFIEIAGMAMSHGGIAVDDFLGRRRWELPTLKPLNTTWEAHGAVLNRHLPFSDLLLEYTDREGSVHFESVAGRPIFDAQGIFRGYRGVGTDVTEKREIEQAMRESEARFRNLVELSSDWYWEQNDQFRYTFLSQGRQRVIDADIAARLGKTRWELDVTGPTEVQWADHRRLLEAHLPFRNFEYNWTTKEGELFNVSVSGDPIFDDSGRFTGYRGTGTDITHRKRVEAEIHALNVTLEERVRQRTAALNAANDDLRALGYSIAHDMRAPLRAIGGFSQMLCEHHLSRLDAEGNALFSRILTNVEWMGQLIDGLLSLSQLSMASVAREPIDLSAISQEIFDELQRLEPARRVELMMAEVPIIEGDRIMVRRMMQNLIGNAWKYSVNEPLARIEIGMQKGADGTPTYFIKDNGAGFDMTYAGKLFQAFQRLHSPSEFQGSGIGLAIVSLIVRKHGGQIRAEAAVGEGAAFYFTVPSEGQT